METVTTALGGTLIAQAGFRQRMGPVATVALTVSATVPDLDGVLRLRDTAFYLSHHRGITHSFVGGAVLALVLAAIFYRFSAYRHYWRLAGICYLGILFHIVTDLCTSYGTKVFLPFSDRRFAWDILFIIDIFVTGIIIGGVVIAYWLQSRSIQIGRIALAFLGGYVLVAAVSHQIALGRLHDQVGRAGLPANNLAVFPRPFGPLRWSGVVTAGDATYQTLISLLDRQDRPFRVYQQPPDSQVLQRAEQVDVVAVFRRFARFPVVSVRQDTNGPVVEYFDLQFGQIEGRRPFLLEVAFDQNGKPRFAGFVRR